MMERKYQLVAWTADSRVDGKARLYMIPSLEREVEISLVNDLAQIHKEVHKSNGHVNIDLARRAIKAYENMSRFKLLTGHTGDGIRYLFFAARYCIREDLSNGNFHGTYSYSSNELRYEFVRLCEEGRHLAKKLGREDILLETKPKLMLEIYCWQLQENREIRCDLKDLSA